MANSFYNASGTPGTGTLAASAPIRSEYSAIAAGFDLLPTLSAGTASKAVVINSGGTAITVTTGTLALAGNFATTGAFATTLVAGADVSLTLPLVDGTLATLAGPEILSNKSLVGVALGTPVSGVATNLTGTASGLTAGHVTTNANLTGPITSSGNATAVGSQTGTGSTFVMSASPTLVTPVLGVATATSINGLIVTTTTGTFTLTNGKTFAVAKSLTLDGTDSTTMTFPSTSATIARTDAANTFTGTQTFSTPIATGSVATMTATVGGGVPTPPNDATKFLRGDGTFAVPGGTGTVTSVSVVTGNGVSGSVATATTTPAITLTLGDITPSKVNGNTITTGTGTLTLGAAKTFTASNTLTLTATDGSTLAIGTGGTLGTAAYVATGTSGATIPLLNGTNTWSASQTFSAAMTLSAALTYGGVTLSNAVTGTGNMALSASPTFTGTVTTATLASGAHTITSASATALVIGPNGATAPVFTVDDSTASQAAGLKITGAATAGTVAIVATDSGGNTNLSIDAKGSGTITIGGTSTGAVSIPSLVPPGSMVAYAGSSAPTGWLLCFGQSVLRTDYPALFTAIGVTFGSVDGTHFTLPDMRGRVAAGVDNMGGSAANRLGSGATGGITGSAVLAASGGQQSHTMTSSELVAHTHGAGSFKVTIPTNVTTGASAGLSNTTDAGTSTDISVTGTSDSTGSTTAFNTVAPTLVLNYIIKQ